MRGPHAVGDLRRTQIVEAAVGVIADAGLPALSLSAIEKRAGMSRGQLTYYFGTKEEILLAVFDHLLGMMRAEAEGGAGTAHVGPSEAGWQRLQAILTWFILDPPDNPGFHALQHTFLSQIGHRDDFRQRLAGCFEDWRGHVADDVAGAMAEGPTGPPVSARTVASLVVAFLEGLRTQEAAQPGAFDRQEMLTLVLHLFGGYLNRPAADGPARPARPRNGRSRSQHPRTPKA